MLNYDKGIFNSVPKSKILEHMKNKNKYCELHQDYGHYTATCRSLYEQVMLMIIGGGL